MDGESSLSCFLSLVIPAYNEADGIAHAIHEADASLAGLGVSYEIIVVDDGSSDATAMVVALTARQIASVRLVRHEVNLGYGAALRSGFEAARGQRIAFTDADCQFYLADLRSLIQLTDQHPIAVGYRVDRQDSWRRKFYSRAYNLAARALLGTTVRDIDCALKVFRREALARILPESRGFFVNTEMLTNARQQRLRVAETGVAHRPRLRGKSKVSLLDIPRTLNALLPFWWSRVMFPRQQQVNDSGGAGQWIHVALLTIMAALLFFGRLHAPLLEPEEARYAEIPRQMLAEGRVLTPVLHGEPYYHKPPLLYWLVMGCYQVFGVHDWAARVVPAMTGVLIVLLTYIWAARVVGSWAAFAGALMLCLSAKFIYQAGMLTFDAPLGLFVLAALACSHVALRGSTLRRGWWLLGGVACGLGVLTKGPVALALSVPPLLAWQFFERRGVRASGRCWAVWLASAALIAGPWFVVIGWRDPRALGDFFWLHNLVRYLRPLDHSEPAWFYVPDLLVGTLPWSLLLAPLIGYLGKRSPAAGKRRPAALGLFLIALTWLVTFFSLSGCKRAGYILPAFPLLALVLGVYVANVIQWRIVADSLCRRVARAWAAWTHWVTMGALGVAMIMCGGAAVRGWWPWPVAAGAEVVLLSLLAGLWRHGPDRIAWRGGTTCGGVMFALLLLGVHLLLPNYHRAFALRGQVRRHHELAQDMDLSVASYPKRWDSISFYLERNDVEAYTPELRAAMIRDLQKQERTLLFVKQGESLDDLMSALPPELEFVPRGRPGGKVVTGMVQKKKPSR